mgnify:CR=1 FL=1
MPPGMERTMSKGKYQSSRGSRRGASKKKGSVLVPVILGIAGALVLLTGCAGVLLLRDTENDVIHDNVSACGVDLGGMTKEAAAEALQTAVGDKYKTNDLVIRMATGDPIVLKPEDTKVQFDAEAAAQTAYEFGRSGNVFSRLFQRAEETANKVELDSEGYLTYDKAYVQRVAEERALSAHKELIQPTVEEITEAADTTEETGAPQRKLRIVTGVDQNDYTAQQIADAVRQAYSGLEFEVTLDYPNRTADPVDVDALYEQYHVEAEDARFDKQTQAVVPEVVGCDFDKEALKQALAEAAPGTELFVELLAVQPNLTAEQLSGDLYMDVLGSCDTSHTAIADRTHNLILACEAVNDTVVMPGEVFSFNNTVGERTAAKGYRAAIVYVGGHSKPELGGGVCQVASTIYSACLYADLEIVESTCHQFFCTYTNPGMDATIYWGSLDYKFRNNTPFPLKIQASVSGGQVHVKLLGTDVKDYTVKMSWEYVDKEDWKEVKHVIEPGEDYRPGQVIDTPYTGYTVKTYMTKIDLNGNVISKTLVRTSHYDKRDKVIAVSSLDEPAPTETTEPKPTDPTEPAPTDPKPTDPTEPAPTESSETTPPSSETTPPSSETEPPAPPPSSETDSPAPPPSEDPPAEG